MDNYNIFPKILFSYLIKIFLKNILLVLLIFLFLIYLVDFIEIYRRASEKINFNNNDNFISILIYLSFLKSPITIKNILPISILISSILTFIKWRQNNYFVIVRTLGISLKKNHFSSLHSSIIYGIIVIIFFTSFRKLL